MNTLYKNPRQFSFFYYIEKGIKIILKKHKTHSKNNETKQQYPTHTNKMKNLQYEKFTIIKTNITNKLITTNKMKNKTNNSNNNNNKNYVLFHKNV